MLLRNTSEQVAGMSCPPWQGGRRALCDRGSHKVAATDPPPALRDRRRFAPPLRGRGFSSERSFVATFRLSR